MDIKNLTGVGFETVFRGFERAFADYAISFEKDEVRSMLKRRGYNPELSFAAFEGNDIVGFTLNGTGTFNGVATAYDTGTGTAKEYRGQGLAGKIFNHSLPFLKDAGISQYLLEVLQDNSRAISIYRKIGFEITREFDCFRQAINQLSFTGKENKDCSVKEISTEDVSALDRFCSFAPSWQNSSESIGRGAGGLQFLGAFVDGHNVGYCVIDPQSGDIAQLAVREEMRRQGIASRLLHEAIARMSTEHLKVLNVDSREVEMHAFLAARNIALASRQFEMVLPL